MAKIDAIDALLEFVQETKPFHSKVLEVLIEYVYNDRISVNITEQLQIDTELIFDNQLGYHPEGYGLTALGYLNRLGLFPNGIPLNPLYDPLSVNYVPQLDRNNILFDPDAVNSSPPPSQAQKDASFVYAEFVEGFLESNWDNVLTATPISSTAVAVTLDELLNVDVERNNNFAGDFYVSYDVIEAFSYSNNNGTITQDVTLTPSPTNVVALVNDFHTDDGGVYYVDLNIDSLNVPPSGFSVGIVEADDQWNFPYTMPNNNQLVGYYPDDYGYKADGTGVNNNVSSPLGVGYTTGDIIRVEIDYTTSRVNFYKNTVLVGFMSISDPTKTYYFAVSMTYNAGNTQVSIV